MTGQRCRCMVVSQGIRHQAWDGAFLPGRSLAVGTPSHRWEQWPVTLAQLRPAQPALTATSPPPLALSWSVDGPESDPARPSCPGPRSFCLVTLSPVPKHAFDEEPEVQTRRDFVASPHRPQHGSWHS